MVEELEVEMGLLFFAAWRTANDYLPPSQKKFKNNGSLQVLKNDSDDSPADSIFKFHPNHVRGFSDTHIIFSLRTLAAHQHHRCVTSASAFCHSAVANGLHTAATCLCSTPYRALIKCSALYWMGGLKESGGERGGEVLSS